MKTSKRQNSVIFIASLLVLFAGISLIFIGLLAPPIGVIDMSLIAAFGEFLAFVGAVWNLDYKYNYKANELESRISKFKAQEEDEEDSQDK